MEGPTSNTSMSKLKFIDLFAGCGGLSLGLSLGGLEGQFAIERDAMAFETFKENFLAARDLPIARFAWPQWLALQPWSIDELLDKHGIEVAGLAHQIDVLAGGPPCQGFSFAGKRQETDPRNQLFEKYAQVVDTIRPRVLVLENVPGMRVAHSSPDTPGGGRAKAGESFYDKLRKKLETMGYEVHGQVLDASRYGVPQKRSRLIVIGLEKQLAERLDGGPRRVFELMEEQRATQLRELGLGETITARDAISDLEVEGAARKPCADPQSRGPFEEAVYKEPLTPYQRLMHGACSSDAMDSMRLARHSAKVRDRFAAILDECRRGVRLDQASRERHGLKKHRGKREAPRLPRLVPLPGTIYHRRP
ncbi:cytosine-specific methyltransferase, putative [Ricinus communis]|uniref:Cytosine-specific methyltransferase n=1 Tax=Ricinus communis TaxID=3988 RepID=B9T8L9_RICCO|nr:cytosine-specific methyltransferase, putative [Ricinus communis]